MSAASGSGIVFFSFLLWKRCARIGTNKRQKGSVIRLDKRGRESVRFYCKDKKMEEGKIFKFHDDLDTDQIIASQYLLLPDLEEMKGHAFESLDPDFSRKVKPGDFVVGGENFGCGSSREQAPGVLKALGVKAVIAKSFARIFFRNAINIGLPAIVCKDLPDQVETGDVMSLSLSEGTVTCKGNTYPCTKLAEYMQNILNQGGLIASLNREEE